MMNGDFVPRILVTVLAFLLLAGSLIAVDDATTPKLYTQSVYMRVADIIMHALIFFLTLMVWIITVRWWVCGKHPFEWE